MTENEHLHSQDTWSGVFKAIRTCLPLLHTSMTFLVPLSPEWGSLALAIKLQDSQPVLSHSSYPYSGSGRDIAGYADQLIEPVDISLFKGYNWVSNHWGTG